MSWRIAATVGLPGMGVSSVCGNGNDAFVVMLCLAKAGFARLVSETINSASVHLYV